MLGFLIVTSPVSAVEILVPDDYPTIQAGIDAAAVGDTVLVARGTYFEIINMKADVNLRSETGQADCVVIDGGGYDIGGVVRFVDLYSSPLLEGFTLTNGGHHGLEVYRTDPVIRNCIITGNTTNTHGGGVYVHRGSPSFFNCEISDNHAVMVSGGVSTSNGSVVSMTGCQIVGNSSGWYGGGLVIGEGSILNDCLISGNRSKSGSGGGIVCAGHVVLESCLINRNTAQVNGGGVFVSGEEGGGANAEFLNCIISDNRSLYGSGGGIYSEGNPTLTGCKIWGNVAEDGNGGGMSLEGSPKLFGCLVVDNIANKYGGGLYCTPTDSARVKRCSIIGNSAKVNGGGIYSYGRMLSLTQNIIAFSRKGAGLYCYGDNSGVIIWQCDVFGNEGGDQICGIEVGGNFSADPLFCDLASGNMELDFGSPCLLGPGPNYFVIGAEGLGDCSVAPVEDVDLPDSALSELLGQNHPNPFNPRTAIPFYLESSGTPRLQIFDLGGRRVRTLLAGDLIEAGQREIIWNGRDDSGHSVPSGIYFYRLDTGTLSRTRRMVLMK